MKYAKFKQAVIIFFVNGILISYFSCVRNDKIVALKKINSNFIQINWSVLKGAYDLGSLCPDPQAIIAAAKFSKDIGMAVLMGLMAAISFGRAFWMACPRGRRGEVYPVDRYSAVS